MKRKHFMWLNSWDVLTDVCLTESAGKAAMLRSGWCSCLCLCPKFRGRCWQLAVSHGLLEPLPVCCTVGLSMLGVGSVPGAGLPAKSFPLPAPTAFSPLQYSFFLASLLLFSGSWLCFFLVLQEVVTGFSEGFWHRSCQNKITLKVLVLTSWLQLNVLPL